MYGQFERQKTCPNQRPNDRDRRGYSRKRTVAYTDDETFVYDGGVSTFVYETLELAPAITYILLCAHTNTHTHTEMWRVFFESKRSVS